MRNLTIAVVVGLVLVAGCTSEAAPEPSTPTPSSTTTAAESPELTFAPTDYSYVVQSECGERSFIGEFRIIVADGEIIDAARLDDAPSQALTEEDYEWMMTIGDIVDEYNLAKGTPNAKITKSRADMATIDWPADSEYPTFVNIDWSLNGMDDEACYFLSEYKPTG